MRDGWKLATLGDICTLTKGVTPTQKAIPGPYPLVVTAADFLSSDTFQFEGEAVCVPLVSSTGHGHASLKRVHYATGQFAVANIITALQAKTGAPVNMKYLWLLLDHGKDSIIVPLMKGTANVSLSQRALASTHLLLPPLDEQRRIVDLIESLDDAIDSTRSNVSSGKRAYEGILQRIALEGEGTPIGSVVETARSGGTPSRKNPDYFNGDIPWIKSGEVAQGQIASSEETITEAAVKASSAWMVPVGATLVAMYGATRGAVGQVVSPVTTNQAVLALVPDESKILPGFLVHAVRSRSSSLRSKGVGAAQPNLSKSTVIAEEIPVPSLERQAEVADLCDELLATVQQSSQSAALLRGLRSDLLTVLFSGEHKIPESYDEFLEEVTA